MITRARAALFCILELFSHIYLLHRVWLTYELEILGISSAISWIYTSIFLEIRCRAIRRCAAGAVNHFHKRGRGASEIVIQALRGHADVEAAAPLLTRPR